MNKKMVSIRLSDTDIKRVEEIAKTFGWDKTNAIKQSIEEMYYLYTKKGEKEIKELIKLKGQKNGSKNK